ncbi:quinone oxidoreductase family protein [Streptomyces sp. SS162]|uniref:quinone oxidoreductase family protein n=1 Tax=Streptomyces sp. SS162 TaxID=3108484 RepID=UPI002F40D459
MRAVTMSSHGGPEVLRLTAVPEPEPKAGHHRVEVLQAGVNYADLHVREGDYLAGVTLPYVPGNEVMGYSDGRRVVALTRGGGYAQVALAHRRSTIPVPDDIDDATAISLTLQGNSAWHLLHTVLRISPGETVIVPAAAGGVGSLAVQLAKRAGARVVALAGTDSKRALALGLGADAVVDSTSTSLAVALKEATHGAAAAALEMTGGDTLHSTLEALAPMGRMAVYGSVSGIETTITTRDLMATGKTVSGFWLPLLFGHRTALRDSMADLFQAVRDGELAVPAPTVYPLSEAARAHEDMAARRTTGKVVLDPAA